MENGKGDEEIYKWLSVAEEKLMEQSQVIRALSYSILDLSKRLEAVEDDNEKEYVRSNVQIEDREAYLQRLEVEDWDRWIELISEGEPSGSAPSSSS